MAKHGMKPKILNESSARFPDSSIYQLLFVCCGIQTPYLLTVLEQSDYGSDACIIYV